MSWKPVRVRQAVADDLETLLVLGGELREQVLPAESRGARGVAARNALAARYLEALADPAREVVLAVAGRDSEPEEVLGMAVLTVANTNALLDLPAVHLTHAVVAAAHRRRGAGKALVARAAALAEERGLDQIVVSVHPGARDAARFYARLGFAPVAVRRTAPLAVVRRRLAALERGTEPVTRRARRVTALATRVRQTDGAGS